MLQQSVSMLNGLVLIELFSTLSFTFYTMPQSPIPSSTFFSMLFLCRCFYVPFTHMHTPIEASESMLGLVSCPLRLVHADKSNHLLYHLSYSHHRAKSSASSQKQECSPPPPLWTYNHLMSSNTLSPSPSPTFSHKHFKKSFNISFHFRLFYAVLKYDWQGVVCGAAAWHLQSRLTGIKSFAFCLSWLLLVCWAGRGWLQLWCEQQLCEI